MKFVAVDVETANANMASICSIGVATFENGVIANEWYSLVDPQDFFDPINTRIHGIDESSVKGAPVFSDIAPSLEPLLSGETVVTHTGFDRAAMHQAARRFSVQIPTCTWLDSARVVRRAWADCSQRGYGLQDACERIGYQFKHHDALEDAKAAGHVLLAATADLGLDIEGVLKRIKQPIDPKSTAALTQKGNPEGSLFGEVVVFTGALDIPRREAATLAAAVGCEVAKGVTKKTTLLVVGDVDVTRLAGHQKSSKHRKAEELISNGSPIRILRETDFRELIAI